jgi:hypothetical protein
MNPGHNLRVRFGDAERFRIDNTGDVNVGRDLRVGGGAAVPAGVMANAIGIGTQQYGASDYAYESIELNPYHNLRIRFGGTERMQLNNDGSLYIMFDGGYWAFQNDGNLVKYRADGTALYDTNPGW